MRLTDFNKLDTIAAAKELFSCCGAELWVASLMRHFPFASEKEMINNATSIWYNECDTKDWLQSFSHHPRIGDTKSLKEKFAGKEQEGVTEASGEVIEALVKANADYEKKFGFIFIVCATGRSAGEMLRLLQDRTKNSYAEELRIAMGEQHKITMIRFKKLFTDANFQFLNMSQLTTHVLDTSIGRPGSDITIRLMGKAGDGWQTMAQGVTDADGRISDLLPPEKNLIPGIYKLVFETGNYFAGNNVKGFYPEVEIQFNIIDDVHYHVPLLINPFGYSTYRGS
jgi:5-hydroxyisourate hydrolase/2-oxo-4-hydroxy-4-carboxy-5-ureidoimidazoline decarboxylase